MVDFVIAMLVYQSVYCVYIYILCMPYSVSTYRISYIPVLYPFPSKNNIKPNCLRNIGKSIKNKPAKKKPSGPRQRHRPLEIPSSKIQGDWRMDRLPINQPPRKRILRENRSYIQNLHVRSHFPTHHHQHHQQHHHHHNLHNHHLKIS